MYIIWMLLVGLLVGVVAKLIMPGHDPAGLFITILLGIVGSVAAGVIGSAIGWYQEEWSGPGFVASVGGAMLLLILYRLMGGSTRTS